MKNLIPGFKMYLVAALTFAYGGYEIYTGDFAAGVDYLFGGGALAAGRATAAKIQDALDSVTNRG